MNNTQFAAVAVVVVGGMQAAAWYFGHNGQVFAFTSLVIGVIVGKILNVSLNFNKQPPKKSG